MAGTTPNLGLYLPGGGSTGAWTPDEVADVDPINQNFQKVDTFAGTVGVQANRNQQFYGPAAAISSVVGQKLGDEYQESDGNKILWRYDGSNWTQYSTGLVKIRPASVTGPGTSIDANGDIIFAGIGQAPTQLNILGVLSTRYRYYRIVWDNTFSATGSLLWRFGVAGVADASSNYGYQTTFTPTNTTLQTVFQVSSYISMTAIGSGSVFGTLEIEGTAQAELTKYKGETTALNNPTNPNNPMTLIQGFFGGTQAFDSLHLLCTAAGYTMTGRVSIYGYN